MKPEKINNPGDVFKHLGDMMKPEGKYPELSKFFNVIDKAEKDLHKLVSVPSILRCGDEPNLCKCGELATKEAVYYQESYGKLRKFNQLICEDCLNDGYFFIGKTVVSIMPYKSDEQIQEDHDYDNRMFTEN